MSLQTHRLQTLDQIREFVIPKLFAAEVNVFSRDILTPCRSG